MELASLAVRSSLPPGRTTVGLLRRKRDPVVPPHERRELREVQKEQVELIARLRVLEKQRDIYTTRARETV